MPIGLIIGYIKKNNPDTATAYNYNLYITYSGYYKSGLTYLQNYKEGDEESHV